MKRKMKSDRLDCTLNVSCWFMTVNQWEYYLEAPDENGIAFGWVDGDYPELGYVDINEIRPYIISSCLDITGLNMPAVGWNWVDN